MKQNWKGAGADRPAAPVALPVTSCPVSVPWSAVGGRDNSTAQPGLRMSVEDPVRHHIVSPGKRDRMFPHLIGFTGTPPLLRGRKGTTLLQTALAEHPGTSRSWLRPEKFGAVLDRETQPWYAADMPDTDSRPLTAFVPDRPEYDVLPARDAIVRGLSRIVSPNVAPMIAASGLVEIQGFLTGAKAAYPVTSPTCRIPGSAHCAVFDHAVAPRRRRRC
jgi:hypothetical protein